MNRDSLLDTLVKLTGLCAALFAGTAFLQALLALLFCGVGDYPRGWNPLLLFFFGGCQLLVAVFLIRGSKAVVDLSSVSASARELQDNQRAITSIEPAEVFSAVVSVMGLWLCLWALRSLLWSMFSFSRALQDHDFYMQLVWRLIWFAAAIILGMIFLKKNSFFVRFAYPGRSPSAPNGTDSDNRKA